MRVVLCDRVLVYAHMGHSINEVVSSPYRTDTQATFGLKTEFEQFTRPLHNDQVQYEDATM